MNWRKETDTPYPVGAALYVASTKSVYYGERVVVTGAYMKREFGFGFGYRRSTRWCYECTSPRGRVVKYFPPHRVLSSTNPKLGRRGFSAWARSVEPAYINQMEN